MENPTHLKPFAEWMRTRQTNTQRSAVTQEPTQPLLFGEVRGIDIDMMRTCETNTHTQRSIGVPLEPTQPMLFGEVRGDDIDSGQLGHGIAQLALPGHTTKRAKRTQSLAEIAVCRRAHRAHSTQCQEALNELCRTEASFVGDLDQLLKTRHKAEAAGVKQDDLDVVFRNAKDLFRLHELFLKSINALSISSARFIEDTQNAFVLAIPEIHTAYKVFCGGSLRANRHLQKMKDAGIQWPSGCIPLWSVNQLTLDAFLIKPIQRLTLYPLLLDQIGKHAPEGHRLLTVKKILEITLDDVNNATPLDTSPPAVQSGSIRKHWPWQR